MGNNIILLAVTLVVFTACNNPSKKNDVKTGVDSTEKLIADDSVLLKNSAKIQFDGVGEDEIFTIVVRGSDTLNASVQFTITSGDGNEIYKDVFASNMLAATYNEEIVTKSQQIDLIKKRVRTFFDDANFKMPAIDDNMPHDPAFIDTATYGDLKKGHMKGFVYVIGKENAKYIAWSPLKNKVVMYFNCC